MKSFLVKPGKLWYTRSIQRIREEREIEPVCYTVQTINGDYAYLLSDSGVENQVAMFLLPEGTDVGSRLLWENFQWTLL